MSNLEELEFEEFEDEICMLNFEDVELTNDVPAVVRGFTLRGYQSEALASIASGWSDFPRLLAVLATGCGKTVIFSQATRDEVDAGGKVLILAHTDELLEQAIDKLEKSTGLLAEKEKAGNQASPFANVVVGSIQTLTRTNRLTGFADDHFSLVIVDEAHRSLAPSYQKVLRYFHFGAESLNDDWEMPEPGVEYTPKARVLGVTATADRGDRRSLGEFFQKCVFDYGLLQAVRDGYLVRPVTHNIPLQIDIRGVKVKRSAGGADFDVSEVVQRISPFLREAARCIAAAAFDRKTVVFMPSIDTARLGAEASASFGMNASYVSGACADRKQKIADFDSAGNGSIIYNAMLLTEGWDCPDVSCICVMRPTKIRGLYVQCVGRGTRPLPGLVDGLDSPEKRVAAIANSAKPDLRVIDFLWLSDRLDLIQPVDLVATRPEVRERMMADGGAKNVDVDLVEAGESAERDLLESLEKAAKEHSKKSTRIIDPLAWAVSIGDSALIGWEPETLEDALAPTPGQIALLKSMQIDATGIKHRGLARKMLSRAIARQKMGLCTPKQLNFLKGLGVMESVSATLTISEATATITRLKAQQSNRPPAAPRSSA